jgi:hypothetical protein
MAEPPICLAGEYRRAINVAMFGSTVVDSMFPRIFWEHYSKKQFRTGKSGKNKALTPRGDNTVHLGISKLRSHKFTKISQILRKFRKL